jgi:hypothetical protein
MCGRFSYVEIDRAWPDRALNAMGWFMAAVQCPVLANDKPTPLAFFYSGRAVLVNWQIDRSAVRPITPTVLAVDIVPHICRPARPRAVS